MKNLIIFVLCLVMSSCASTYKPQNFAQTKNQVHIIAILPYSITIDGRNSPKGVSADAMKNSQEQTGYDIQDKSYTYFLRRMNDYSVQFQDIAKTNALLRKANIDFDGLAIQDKGELCKILHVDAVISGRAMFSKPMSQGASIATGLLFGSFGATNKTVVSLSIHNKDSELVWKYDWSDSGAFSSSEEITNHLLRNASKKFPYKI